MICPGRGKHHILWPASTPQITLPSPHFHSPTTNQHAFAAAVGPHNAREVA